MKGQCGIVDDGRPVLVTGATGAIGPRVVQRLCDARYHVRILTVNAPQTGILPENIELHVGDITNQRAVDSAAHGVQAVIHLAALLHNSNPSPTLRARYEQVNLGGTEKLINAATKAGVKRVVMFSTIAVYGRSGGQVLTEESPVHPDTFYAQTKVAAEQIVLNAKLQDGKPMGTVLRLGAVYGARVKGNYQRLVRALARKRFIRIGNGRNRRTLVYDRDVASAAVLAMQHPAAAGRVYDVSDGQYHSLNEIISTICWALGRVPPSFSLPIGLVRFSVAGFEDGAKLLGCQPPIGRWTIDKYTEDVAVDSSRIREELGFVPQYDLRAGWRDTINEMRQNGDLD